MERILVTGGEELLARHFERMYRGVYDVRLLCRRPSRAGEFYWNPLRDELDPAALEGVNHIVHTAGIAGVGSRLDLRGRDRLWRERVGGAALIGRHLLASGAQLESFVNVSSTAIYGSGLEPYIHTEASPVGSGFLASLYVGGEEEAYLLEAEALAKRWVSLRMGEVLCGYGGVLPYMAVGGNYGLALLCGIGQQLVPWVHVSDAMRSIWLAIENREMRGVYNVVAPEWVSYREIATLSAQMRSGRSLPLPIPRGVWRAAVGAWGGPLMHSQRVASERIEELGFDYLYPDISGALQHIYGE